MSSTPQVTRFNKVTNNVFLSSNPSTTPVKGAPTMIVVCGWMSARLAHLKKYISLHNELFPGTPVLLIRSNPQFLFLPRPFRLRALNSVIPLLPTSNILYHVFSNGGCANFSDLLMLRPIMTPSRIIFDSCPGAFDHELSLRAFLVPFKNPVVRSLGHLVLTIIFHLFAFIDFLCQRSYFSQRLRVPLNDTKHIILSTPRAYLYSDEDELVQAWAVEEHGREAQIKGYPVTYKRFHGSGHAAHLKHHPTMYREAVKTLWETASG